MLSTLHIKDELHAILLKRWKTIFLVVLERNPAGPGHVTHHPVKLPVSLFIHFLCLLAVVAINTLPLN